MVVVVVARAALEGGGSPRPVPGAAANDGEGAVGRRLRRLEARAALAAAILPHATTTAVEEARAVAALAAVPGAARRPLSCSQVRDHSVSDQRSDI